ncbi:MATE family efflux transporter [Galactobacter caseinivorans]|uniref:MATE family efflux transporter n=1 Tax=Galactobacter caseinivorans TaxID=2676123 RepID=A0A496PJ39_9MICC|nr:MATE family efflux transporter [Galactobacter caseinivorans]
MQSSPQPPAEPSAKPRRTAAGRPARQQFPGLTKQILVLAVPALGALIAEPLFLLADTAIVGHLGVEQLAGAGLGTTVLGTVVGLMVFLAYATTPAVARQFGAGNLPKALASGRDGVWLGLFLGLVLAVVGFATAPTLAEWMGARGATADYAVEYLRWSMPGVPAMLLVLAATGVLRGLQDGRTPLLVAGGGFGINICLNFVLVYGVGLGVGGSALGTSIAQWLMALVYVALLVPRLRRRSVSLRPSVAGLRRSAHAGGWLMLRTLSLRIAILATVWVATSQGAITLAAHQLVFTMFSTLAFALDALAVAAQSLIGKELGAGDKDRTRALTRTMMRWGVWFGLFTGAMLAALAWVLPPLFTPDAAVQSAATLGMFILAASQPVCGLVFVLDGVLIGAEDARYLALTGLLNLALYAPLLVLTDVLALPGEALVWIWVAFCGYLLARAATLSWRVRNDRWMRVGA